MKEESRQNITAGCAEISAVAGVVLAIILIKNVSGHVTKVPQFLVIYGCLAVAMAAALIIYGVLRHILKDAGTTLIPMGSRAHSIIAATAVLGGAVAIYLLQIKDSYFLQVGGKGGIAAICLMTVLLFITIISVPHIGNWGGRLILLASITVCIFTAILYTYAPNILNQNFYVLHHYTAVTQSIYNVSFNEPYTVSSSGVYGHYAIFLWPFLKIFGHSPKTIAVILSIESVICLLAFAAVICKMTKDGIIRSLAVLSLGTLFSYTNLYAAYYPTRVIMPVLLMAYVCWCQGISKRLFWAIGYLLCSIAITWQTDSGLAATLAFTAYLWIDTWRENRPFSKPALKTYAITSIGCVAAVSGMILIINLYNLLCGGKLILKECFFPLVGSEGYVGNLQTGVAGTHISWTIPIAILIFATVAGLLGCYRRKEREADAAGYLAFAGVIGLGMGYYFFNRGAAGWSCMFCYVIICVAALAEKARNVESLTGRKGLGMLALLYLCMYTVNLTMVLPGFYNAKINTEINSMESMENVASSVAREVPKDTYAFGLYTQEVYGYLGWNPGYHGRDVSDFWGIGVNPLLEDIQRQDDLLVSVSNYGLIQPDSGFVITGCIPEDAPVFYYCQNIRKFPKSSVVTEGRNLIISSGGSVQTIALPIEFKEKTIYKVDVTLAQNVDFAVAAGLHVDFYAGPEYDRPAQQVSGFVRNGQFQYTLYIYSGDIDTGSVSGYVRMINYDTSKEIEVDMLQVTELLTNED